MTMSTSLVSKVAISSRSIGAAIAHRLAEDGADIIINYVSNSRAADEVINGINSRGKGKAVEVKADVSSITGANHLLEESVKVFGKIDRSPGPVNAPSSAEARWSSKSSSLLVSTRRKDLVYQRRLLLLS